MSVDECITCAVLMLFKDSKISQLPCKPIRLYETLKKKNKRCCEILNGRQEDAHEFLLMVADEMDVEKHSLKWFVNNFVAEVRTLLRCSICKSIYQSDSHIGDFTVNINGKKSIQAALDMFFDGETVDDYQCTRCNKLVTAKKQFSLISAPSCLCVTLKRFSKNGKINRNIEVTRELTTTKYFVESPVNSPKSQWKYKLVAVINHKGKTRISGHYTTIVCSQNNEFYEFDDSTVRQVNDTAIKGNEAYILFYERSEVDKFNFFVVYFLLIKFSIFHLSRLNVTRTNI